MAEITVQAVSHTMLQFIVCCYLFHVTADPLKTHFSTSMHNILCEELVSGTAKPYRTGIAKKLEVLGYYFVKLELHP